MQLTINRSYKAFIEDRNRILIAYGGAGSSKSYTTAQKILTRILTEENHKILITRKVAKTIRVSVFQLFKDLIGDDKNFKINKSDMTITNLRNNSQLIFTGLDDIEKLKSIQGITSIWIEEASEIEENDFNELNRRLRGITKYYKQIILTFNPISHLHWLKARFFDNENSKASIYKTTYKDNRFIDDEYIQELLELKEYDIQQYNIYALGEWGVLNSNKVYHNYDFIKHSTQLSINDFEILHGGVDFNVGGTVCVLVGIKDGKAYVVGLEVGHDTEDLTTRLLKYKKVILYPDASGSQRSTNATRTDIDILKEYGFEIKARKSNPPIRDRIHTLNRLFAKDMLYINNERVSHALQTQVYTDRGEPEKFTDHRNGSIDDINDALGYIIFFIFGIIGKTKIKNKAVSYG